MNLAPGFILQNLLTRDMSCAQRQVWNKKHPFLHRMIQAEPDVVNAPYVIWSTLLLVRHNAMLRLATHVMAMPMSNDAGALYGKPTDKYALGLQIFGQWNWVESGLSQDAARATRRVWARRFGLVEVIETHPDSGDFACNTEARE